MRCKVLSIDNINKLEKDNKKLKDKCDKYLSIIKSIKEIVLQHQGPDSCKKCDGYGCQDCYCEDLSDIYLLLKEVQIG